MTVGKTTLIMTEFIIYQCVVQYRQPIKEDGSLGHPEIIKRFVSEIKGKKATYIKTNKQKDLESKEKSKKIASELFKTRVGNI